MITEGNQMKRALVIGIVCLTVGFIGGRYGKPAKVTETSQVQQDAQTDRNKVDNSRTTIVEVTRPDGTVKKVTRIKKDIVTQTAKDVRTDKRMDTITQYDTGWAVRILVGVRPGDTTLQYGMGLDTRLIGPLTVGAFGLTSGVVGGTIGLQF